MSYLRSMDDLVAGHFVAADPDWNSFEPDGVLDLQERSTQRPTLTCLWTLDAVSFRPVCTWKIAD